MTNFSPVSLAEISARLPEQIFLKRRLRIVEISKHETGSKTSCNRIQISARAEIWPWACASLEFWIVLVPRGRDPCGQRHRSRPLVGVRVTRKRNSFPFLKPMVTVIVSNFWGCAQKPEVRGSRTFCFALPEVTRGLDPWRWPKGSQLWGREWLWM